MASNGYLIVDGHAQFDCTYINRHLAIIYKMGALCMLANHYVTSVELIEVIHIYLTVTNIAVGLHNAGLLGIRCCHKC